MWDFSVIANRGAGGDGGVAPTLARSGGSGESGSSAADGSSHGGACSPAITGFESRGVRARIATPPPPPCIMRDGGTLLPTLSSSSALGSGSTVNSTTWGSGLMIDVWGEPMHSSSLSSGGSGSILEAAGAAPASSARLSLAAAVAEQQAGSPATCPFRPTPRRVGRFTLVESTAPVIGPELSALLQQLQEEAAAADCYAQKKSISELASKRAAPHASASAPDLLRSRGGSSGRRLSAQPEEDDREGPHDQQPGVRAPAAAAPRSPQPGAASKAPLWRVSLVASDGRPTTGTDAAAGVVLQTPPRSPVVGGGSGSQRSSCSGVTEQQQVEGRQATSSPAVLKGRFRIVTQS